MAYSSIRNALQNSSNAAWLNTARSNCGRPNRPKFVRVVGRTPQRGKLRVRPHFAERQLEDRRVDEQKPRRRLAALRDAP
jgi:hypothetical protein